MDKRKPSANFQEKPRKEVNKRTKIKPSDVINLTYRGVEISLVGDNDRLAWDIMSKQEKKKHVSNLQAAMRSGKFKPLSITYEIKSLPYRVMLYVPADYTGTGYELLDIPHDEEERIPTNSTVGTRYK